jgi:hypothetical protein
MITHVTGGKALPREMADQIIDRTDGVSLFIEKLTKVFFIGTLCIFHVVSTIVGNIVNGSLATPRRCLPMPTIALEMIGPMPGTVINRLHPGS